MQLKMFIAGCFGIVGFVASLLAGLYVDNPTSNILMRALMALVLCYVVGYIVGLIAQFIAREHSQRIAAKVEELDAKAQTEQQAKMEQVASHLAATNPPPQPT